VLSQLRGIGARTAQKIIATLSGKVGRFAGDIDAVNVEADTRDTAFTELAMNVLVGQLGYKTLEARQMIFDALRRKATISTPEELLDEIFKTR